MPRTRCKLGQLLGTPGAMTKPDRDLMVRWLQDGTDAHGRRVSGTVMANALQADGHDVGQTTLKDHRAGRCVCWREA